MTAGTCLEHPHHEALLQFIQVPRMHIVVMLCQLQWRWAELGKEDFEAQKVRGRLNPNLYLLWSSVSQSNPLSNYHGNGKIEYR